jgi:hypothetical protein
LVEQELLAIAEHCGRVNDDGMRGTEKSLASGLDAGKRTPRNVPPSPPFSLALRKYGKGPAHEIVDTVPLARLQQDRPPSSGGNDGTETTDSDANKFHLTDLGNGQRLVAAHGDDLRHAHQHGHR